MKRFLIVLLCLICLSAAAFAYSVPDDTVVYVAPTGTKYHREKCSYISSDAKALTILEAEKNGYTACSRCDPDYKTGPYVSNWDGASGGGGSKPSPAPSSSDDSAPESEASAGIFDRVNLYGWILCGASLLIAFFIRPKRRR